MSRLFAIITWGASASRWLSRALDAQPNVLCLHHIPLALQRAGLQSADSMSAMEALLTWGRAYTLAGDCHGVALEAIPEIQKRYVNKFAAAVVTRHPIPRLRSAVALSDERGLDGDAQHALYRRTPALREYARKRAFSHFMLLINRIVDEADLPIFRMEDLVSSQDSLDSLLQTLSDGSVKLSNPNVGFEHPINPHAKDLKTPSDIWQSWPEWCRGTFTKGLTPEARQCYETLGYDFSFLRP